jgi:hypothetical protein
MYFDNTQSLKMIYSARNSKFWWWMLWTYVVSFLQNMHEHKRKYFHLNSIDIHKYSGPLAIQISGWYRQFLGQLQSSPLTMVIWDNLVMVPITRGEPERKCTLRWVAWVKHEDAASLFIPSIVGMWSHECFSSLSLLFCLYTEVIKHPMDL